MKKIGLYLFTNDLRINDNQLLHYAAQSVDKLICVIVEPTLVHFSADLAQEQSYGAHRQAFISQSIANLESNLVKLGQQLVVIHSNHIEPGSAEQTLSQIIATQHVTHFFANAHCGYDERQLIRSIQRQSPNLVMCLPHHSTLFDSHELPFELSKVPSSFTKFRKLVEHLDVNGDETVIANLPPAVTPIATPEPISTIPLFSSSNDEIGVTRDYLGGEDAGLAHLENYFSHDYALSYKQTRNAFDGIENSTKFSPWLALGCVSPKTIYRHLKQFETEHGSNDSTYWIYFELLWREYFYWKGLSLGSSLFGTNNEPDNQHASTTSNLCFAKWKSGNTNYPIVDACMRQLNATGYMSNRGRQLVASCLIYELGTDWRHGAAYFESQLIDYDVASNWGNCAYIAGALNSQVNSQANKKDGANQTQPKSHHFNLAMQTDMYDPDHVFINKWNTCSKEPVLTNNQDVL
ncbi:DASH family cryptochrome [Vibrio splendidus]|uniref:DASH family cryptochrome n=1 Tax=Vibrio splendidus TaxID=29497 RepID=UPI0007F946E7|nr:DASH family cryptochrome [Vibrio splendidus]OBT31620.1 FAD-binding protein [Vibrio splendidus]